MFTTLSDPANKSVWCRITTKKTLIANCYWTLPKINIINMRQIQVKIQLFNLYGYSKVLVINYFKFKFEHE